MEDKKYIENLLHVHVDDLLRFIEQQSAAQFIDSPDGKWSVGQNLDHLNKSISPVNLALRLPRFVVRLMFGKPNRKPRTYAELVTRYHQKLAAGGKASGRFIPPNITWEEKEKLISTFRKETESMNRLMTKWTEEQLDQYLLPHPLLGKLTMREMLFFSVYHIQHHTRLLKDRA